MKMESLIKNNLRYPHLNRNITAILFTLITAVLDSNNKVIKISMIINYINFPISL